MTALSDDGSIASELKESIDEVEEQSDYSLEFDDDQGWRRDASASPTQHEHQQSFAAGRDGVCGSGKSSPTPTSANDTDDAKSPISPRLMAVSRTLRPAANEMKDIRRDTIGVTVEYEEHHSQGKPTVVVADTTRRSKQETLPVQVLALKARLDSISRGDSSGEGRTATESMAAVTREHAALRDCLGVVEQELLTARRKVTQDATMRLRNAQQKRARAESRRVRHFEQLGEAKRVASMAASEAKALRARLEDAGTECRLTQDMLETARSSGSAAEALAEDWKQQAETAKAEANGLRKALSDARIELEEQRRKAAVATTDAADTIELFKKNRDKEVAYAQQASEELARAVELRLSTLPKQHQELLQAEMDRVGRWEERLEAEIVSLQRREEAHKVEIDSFRAHASRLELESRKRAEEDVARERATLRDAKSALERERTELLHRVAKAEALGQSRAAEAASLKAEAEEAFRRIEAEKSALDTRATLLAPQLRVLGERRTALEDAEKEVRGETRRAKEAACRARELEAGVVEREAAVDVKWEETSAARRAVKQMEIRVTEEGEVMAEQKKAVALARVRLLEQQMQMALQMSEIRKALDSMKRLERLEESGARRLALELGTLALDRGEREARRAEVDFETADEVTSIQEKRSVGASSPSGRAGTANVADSVLCQGRSEAKALVKTRLKTPDYPWASTIDLDRDEDAGRGVYAAEAGTREALEKVRFAIAAGRSNLGRSVSFGPPHGTTCPGYSLLTWAGRLRAAAIASGALPAAVGS